jgi:hypothetical protein
LIFKFILKQGVCVNEVKNPILPVTLNRKGDITSTNSGNYYKYVPDAANAYDLYLKANKQSPPTPPDHSASLSAKYLVSKDPNPATLTERKKVELHPQVSFHNDPNDPLHLACSTGEQQQDVTCSNKINYEKPPHHTSSHHRLQQQQPHMKRADYARMILMDPEDRHSFRNNLIRAKSTDVELNRPWSALVDPSDSYKPYYQNNVAGNNNYGNNHNANCMYQPGMLLSNGDHPYFGNFEFFIPSQLRFLFAYNTFSIKLDHVTN